MKQPVKRGLAERGRVTPDVAKSRVFVDDRDEHGHRHGVAVVAGERGCCSATDVVTGVAEAELATGGRDELLDEGEAQPGAGPGAGSGAR